MKQVISAAIIALSFIMPVSVKADPPGGTSGWTKSFEDTFYGGFDSSKWNKTFWWGNGSIDDGAISYYSPNNVSVSSGSLNLEVNDNSEGGRIYWRCC